MRLSAADFARIPYLDVEAFKGRTLNLMPLWDGVQWRQWVPGPNGRLMPLLIHDTAAGDYVAKTPAKEDDLLVPFVEFMWQHASWPRVCPLVNGIIADIHNLATATAKIDHYFDHRAVLGHGVTAFVATEIEYVVAVCRSVFDLLQEIVAGLWNHHVKLLDPEAEARKMKLPPSRFGKMVLDGNGVRPASDIELKYGLTRPLAEAYAEVGSFFAPLKKYRDAVIHGGSGVPLVFNTEQGFCVSPTSRPFADFAIWQPSHYQNQNLVSLRPLLAHLIFGTIGTCGAFVDAFAQQVQFPPPIAPGYRIFLRGMHTPSLLRLEGVLHGESPWWAEPGGAW